MRIGKLVVLATLVTSAIAQGPPHNGPRPVNPGWYALLNARVITEPGKELQLGTVVMRDGRITQVATGMAVPKGATVIDCSGLTIYPGMIEPFFASDVPALDEDTTDKHWNTMVQPQRSALDGGLVGESERKELRALGFTVVAAAPSGGILKGTSSVILLDEPTETDAARVLRNEAYTVASLQTNRGGYPSSEMGSIALLRQSLSDGQWYGRSLAAASNDAALAEHAPQPSSVLAAVFAQRSLPMWFDTSNELQALRCLKIAEEFTRMPVIVGSGMEFRRLQAIAASGATIVVPLQLPDTPDVSTASAADRVTLRQLQTWEHAPSNSKRLLDAGVTIAWTTSRLRKRDDFAARVRDAMEQGVTNAQALAAVTTEPAKLLGIDKQCGTIATGMLANLVVVDGSLFGKECVVRDVWVGGRRHVISTKKDAGLDGTWTIATGWPGDTADGNPTLTIDGKKVTCKLGDDDIKVRSVKRDAHSLTCQLKGKATKDRTFWLRLRIDKDELSSAKPIGNKPSDAKPNSAQLIGVCTPSDGSVTVITATPAEAEKDDEDDEDDEPTATITLTALPTPLGGYGLMEIPKQKNFAILGATLWTGDGRGKLRDGAVVAHDGKIVFAGPRSDAPPLPPNTQIIDGKGKHITAGIIDCHSHTGISRGVNEGGQGVTSEVRIQDVVNPDDVNWYRQLAGGVTAVNQLHGSANVIGGQSNTVKIRWGASHPDDMLAEGSKPGIKFALGENPRRVNRSSTTNTRYPNTRMGVEGVLRDRFAAAEAYARDHKAYAELSPRERAKVMPPRVDLELEALAEVLASRRLIHCHSYRQDEIFMLCGLADEYGIKIGTFQHVLEGYKVADAIKQSAIGASSFSDWWAYKFEVYDAIPDNGAILHEYGVNVSFNSDSNEHARRLNTEAGKAVKYGGVAEHEALHFVTRNPAIQLGIFERTGSLTAGKDADVALWSANPLGYAARCEATWVDGRMMFSLEHDLLARERIQKERQRLLQLALDKGSKKGSRTAKEGDPKDAYWAAEETNNDYCCRNAQGGNK
ncbi:MAG: imidazolonepropionase-like amidohydrolase [Planctomycetota bacterium]|jgi:imidazolonepropionase-like amidohydrolase